MRWRPRLVALLIAVAALALLVERAAWPYWYFAVHRPLMAAIGAI